ncbi:hypothetical protein ACFLIN_03865 [Corynebacterium kutscheri]|uniref:hypothetical protein n=1 Tax=Corynebacterium kutscheri TaxID=35755 RepID=UPI0037BE41E1
MTDPTHNALIHIAQGKTHKVSTTLLTELQEKGLIHLKHTTTITLTEKGHNHLNHTLPI